MMTILETIVFILFGFAVGLVLNFQESKIKDLRSKLDSLNIKVEVYHEDCKR